MNSLGLIIFLSLLFWGIYQKWDDKKLEYTQHALRTSLYFFFSSLALIFIYPKIVTLFTPSILSTIFFIIVLSLTFISYKILKELFRGPSLDISTDRAYWKLLDQKYIIPKLFEIGFQQTFLGAVFIIVVDKYGLIPETIIFFILSFIFAHIPLIFLQGRKIGMTYLKWSLLGAPIFTFLIVTTNSLWYSISIHVLFYTLLSLFTWMFTGTRYSDD